MRKYDFFLLLGLFLLASSCGPDETVVTPVTPNPCPDETPLHDAILYAEYSNTAVSGPSLVFDPSISSSEINFATNPTVNTLADSRIELVYSGVTFKEQKRVYVIDEVISQRKGSTCWLVDDENTLTQTLSKELNIVLILDVSSSLGMNITEIKNSAKAMVTNILVSNPDANIGILKFSRGAVLESFTSSEATLHQFIDANSTFTDPNNGSTYELEGKMETALFESINEAIELLNSLSTDGGKGILTFTDGISNFQFDPQFQDEVEIMDALSTSNISHYTIGYEGNGNTVDRTILEGLAINGDFSFPKNTSELDDIFIRFSNSVAAVYDLRYNTNDALLESPIQHRFLFNTTLVSE